MANKYKLPTPDGKFLLVEPRQAGQSLRLPSGDEIEVPTLLKLRQLEQVVETTTSSEDSGGWPVLQGGCFVVGAGVLLLALIIGGFRYSEAPVPPRAEVPIELDEAFDNLAGAQLYEAWLAYEGVQFGAAGPSEIQKYDDDHTVWLRWMIGCAIAAALGLVMTIVAFVLPNRSAH